MEIAPGLHRLEAPLGERYVAMYLVVGAEAMLLVDTGIDVSVRETLLPYLENAGLDPDRLRYAVLTHSDFDHMGGNAALRELCPRALLLCGEDDRPMIDDLEHMIRDRYGEFGPDHGVPDDEEANAFIRGAARAAPVDIGLRGGERIQLGSREVEIWHTPGHSWGHVSVHDLTTDALMIGDAVLLDGLYTASGDPAFPPTYRDLDTYRATIARMQASSPALLLTAHYPVQRGTQVTDFLAMSRTYTDRVDTAVRDAVGDQPLGLTEIVTAARDRLGPWPSPAAELLVYPILGHLEAFVQRGQLEQGRMSDGRLGYSRAS